MNSNHENDAFELRFEDAVNDTHQRKDRGDQPSAHVWQSIRSHIGTQAETADPRANGRDQRVEQSTVQRSRAMDAALSTREFGYRENRSTRLGWMSLLAAGLVGIMIFTSVWMNGSTPPPDDGSDLAWAPGMGTAESTPMAEEYRCIAENMTVEEVVAIVLNPTISVAELENQPEESAWNGYYEYGRPRLEHWQSGSLPSPSNADALGDAVEFSNDFYSCMATGTVGQVWSMTDPRVLQYEVLRHLPVIRSEESIIGFIEEVIDTPHWKLESGFGFGGYSDPADGMFVAEVRNAENRVSEPGDYSAGRLAVIPMYPVDGSKLLASARVELYLMQYPDGSWYVTGLGHPTGRG